MDREAQKLVNKKFTVKEDESNYVPSFDPVDEDDITFMGRLLRHILKQMNRGFYLDSHSSWYDLDGVQVFGIRFINFMSDTLGTVFL